MKKFTFLFIVLLPLVASTQDKNFTVNLHGFVKSDMFFDSRQTVNVREGHFLLYPKNEQLDLDGKDINAKSTLNLLSIQTRLKVLATGPDVWGAKTSAYIEGEFFGTTDADISGFRLRHAFIKLKWPKTEFLVGQYWHPLFNVRCFPGTVSFNTGAPFQPFTRNPQLRLTKGLGNFNVTLAALWQRDFQSTGPDGASTIYLRNSTLPAFNLSFEYYIKNTANETEFLIGASANYKGLTPRLVTDSSYRTNTKVNSMAFAFFAKYADKFMTFKIYGFLGDDAYNLTMLGGYAVTQISDPVKNYVEYSPISTASVWGEIHTNGKRFQYGLFGGYSKNLGTKEEILGKVYARGADIGYVYRISGRMVYNNGKFRLAPEIEYTVAGYATKDDAGKLNIDKFGTVTDSEPIGNLRVLVGFYYFF